MEFILQVFITALVIQLFADIYMIIKIRNDEDIVESALALIELVMDRQDEIEK